MTALARRSGLPEITEVKILNLAFPQFRVFNMR
jgi:hypothetical protein